MAVAAQPRRLTRRPTEGKLAGVCAGIAEDFDTDVTLVRLGWVVLSVIPGTIIGGLLAYAVAWFILPEAAPTPARGYAGKLLHRSSEDRKIAGVCAGFAEFLSLDPTLVRLAAVVLAIFPGAVICGVLVYAIAWFVMPPAPITAWEPSTSPS